jgi:MoxR-like ATPase
MDYTAATNLISWVPAQNGWFGWPNDVKDADRIAAMKVGEIIVPKFAQSSVYESDRDQVAYIKAICAYFNDDFEARKAEYEATVQSGAGAVPFVMRVTGAAGLKEDVPGEHPWMTVPTERVSLSHPLSTSEFLRLRVVPLEIAGQFKAVVARGKRVQPLSPGAGQVVLDAGTDAVRGPEVLRTESLVRAATTEEALDLLEAADLSVRAGDRAFLVQPDRIPGLHAALTDGALEFTGTAIEMTPAELGPLLTKAKAANKDFKSQRPKLGADELVSFLDSAEPVRSLEEFAHFHDRYVLLAAKVNEALDIVAAGPVDPAPGPDGDDEDPEEGAEETLIHQVEGLAISAVREALPDGMALDDKVLAEAVTALRAGKHLLLSGPPGTGKSTLAAAICKAVGADYRTATATADWTTVDTIGAYLPDGTGGLTFEEGIILQCLDERAWLVIDEINRADIDKAFGPLFSLLAGAGGAVTETVTLPYRRDGKRIEIGWATTADAATADYAVTRAWRLIGTLNDSDKSSLFTLSFAFLRRFAVIDVGLPETSAYRALIASRLPTAVEAMERGRLETAAIAVATGPIPVGPAIMLDVASFTRRGVTETIAGVPPYEDVVEAFLVALRLYVVPQYEGAGDHDVAGLLAAITTVWPSPPAHAWEALKAALGRVSLAG